MVAAWWGNMISLVYFAYLGMVPFEIGVFHLITGITQLLCEIPTGILADKIGPRAVVRLTYGAYLVAFGSYVASSVCGTWLVYFISAPAFGLAYAAMSGSYQSYILGVVGSAGYLQVTSKIESLAMVARSVAMIGGGYLYAEHPALPYSVQTVQLLVAVAVSGMLAPCRVHTASTHSSLATLKDAGTHLLHTRSTVGVAAATFLALVSYEVVWGMFSQPLLLAQGYTVVEVGWIGFLCSAGAAVGLLITHRHAHAPSRYRVSSRSALLVATLLMIIATLTFALAPSPLLSVVGLVWMATLYKSHSVVADSVIQHLLVDKTRATSLSIISSITSIMNYTAMAVTGWVVAHCDTAWVVAGMGIGGGIAAVVVYGVVLWGFGSDDRP